MLKSRTAGVSGVRSYFLLRQDRAQIRGLGREGAQQISDPLGEIFANPPLNQFLLPAPSSSLGVNAGRPTNTPIRLSSTRSALRVQLRVISISMYAFRLLRMYVCSEHSP